LNISVKYFAKNFEDEDSKVAYLNACKWLAKNVISKVEVSETLFSIHKVKEADLPTFRLELHCSFNEGKLGKEFCNRCQEFHRSFYINQEYNCNACKVKAYITGIKNKLITKKSYRRERLGYILNDDNY